jgi:hypothetical protein
VWDEGGEMSFLFKKPTIDVEVTILKPVLDSIYDECDKYDTHETGGRLVGTYEEKGNKFTISALGVIGPGPKAQRSAVSFFQDGNYQEQVFRQIENKIPEIEHLGNWHTHHVNGHPTLSGGDITTYRKTVNHDKHNTNFFYAILVVEKVGGSSRYKIKHYLLRRNDSEVYEIPESKVRIVHGSAVWPLTHSVVSPQASKQEPTPANKERISDQQVFSEDYPDFKPFMTKDSGVFYWKGKIDLVDEGTITAVLLETEEHGRISYELKVAGDTYAELVPKTLIDRKYKSARAAVRELEKKLNREIYQRTKGKER